MATKSIIVTFCSAVVFLTAFTQAQECTPPKKVVFCYYSSWSIYRLTFGKYTINDIDPSLCTHVVYAFAGLNLEGVVHALDSFNDLPENGGEGQYYQFRELKMRNPCIKVMLSIGGWNEGSEKYSLMAETEESRNRFADHLIRYLVYYGFDGVDLDWEYPGQRGGIKADYENYPKLLTAIKARLEPRGRLLAIAVGASDYHVETSYDVAAVSKIVDYVLLMAYDYHRPDVTSHVAPLYKITGDSNSGSVDVSIKNWLDKGCPAEKLVLGMLTSGRSYTLKTDKESYLGAPVQGVGNAGVYTNLEGFISYYEICELIFEGDWYLDKNDTYANNFITKDDQWITYEDKDTIKIKTDYVVSKNLAGGMVWSIDTDDFHAFCDESPNAIQRVIAKGLGLI